MNRLSKPLGSSDNRGGGLYRGSPVVQGPWRSFPDTRAGYEGKKCPAPMTGA
jgi:hypothetical protein